MKNDIIDCMEYIDPELITEAEEYSASDKSRSVYFIIPAAAACAALVLTVNHFTEPKNIREPETDNSVISEVMTTGISDNETYSRTTSDFSENESEQMYSTVFSGCSSEPDSSAVPSVSEYFPPSSSLIPAFPSAQVTGEITSDAAFPDISITFTETVSALPPVTLPRDTEIQEYTKYETTAEKTAGLGGIDYPEETAVPADDYRFMSYSDFGYVRNDLCLMSDVEPGEKLNVRIFEDINSAFSCASSAYSLNEISTESVLLIKTQKEGVYRIYINRFLTDEEKNSILEKIKLLYETTI